MSIESAFARRAVLPLVLLVLGGSTISSAAPANSATPTTASVRLSVTVPRADYGTLHPLGQVSLTSVSATAPAPETAPAPFLTPHPAALAAARLRAASPSAIVSTPTTSISAGTMEGSAANGPLLSGFEAASHDGDIDQWCTAGGACSDPSQSIAPPDDALAVSSTQVAEIVNSTLWGYNRSGTEQFALDLDALFPSCFSSAAILTPTLEPQIAYDPLSDRWYVSGVQLNTTLGKPWSCVEILVSTTSAISASSSWTAYALDWTPSTAPNGMINDEPKLGFSSDKIVVSWNDFACDACKPLGEQTEVIQKSQLLVGPSGLWPPRTVQLFGSNPDNSRFGVVPAVSLSSGSDEWAVYNNSDSTFWQNTSSPTLGMIDISGTPLANNVRYTEYDPSMTPTAAPPYVPQSGTQYLLNTDDDRLLDAVWMNGLLWTTANDACGSTQVDTCARFVEADTVAGSVQVMPGQDWDVGGNGTYAYYPSVTFDADGDMVGSVDVSTSSTLTTVEAVGQAAGYVDKPTLVDAAHASSVADTATCNGCIDGYNGERWGDYGGAAYDPADPHGAWVVGEYTAANVITSGDDDNWATWIQDVEASGPPSGVTAAGGGYTLDAYGGVHNFGDAPPVTITGYWSGWQIANSIAMDPCDSPGQHSGWVMDGFGGLHPFAAAGTPMPAVPDITGYWPGWTIANDVAAFCITVGGVQHAAGCVLDGFGGLHPWADSSAVIGDVPCTGTGYWPNWDIATKITVIPGTDEGYVMDGFGGLHPFNGAPYYAPTGYWPNWTIARGIVATTSGGYTVDGFGGIHAFGNAPAITPTGYWPNWDIVRGITVAYGGTGAYTLDAYGMVHPAGGAPVLGVTSYLSGSSLFCGLVSAP